MKTDLLRYLVVWAHGGVYADFDAESITPIRKWVPDGCEVVVAPETEENFCQWTFAFAKKSEILGAVIEEVVRLSTNLTCSDFWIVHRVTGPDMFTAVLKRELSKRFGIDGRAWSATEWYTYVKEVDDARNVCIRPLDSFTNIDVKHHFASQKEKTELYWNSWLRQRNDFVRECNETIFDLQTNLHFIVRDGQRVAHLESWRATYPSWDILVWTDQTMSEYVRQKHPRRGTVFDELSGVKKADIFRILILHDMGGLYADSDVESFKSVVSYLREHANECYYTEEPDIHKKALYGRPTTDILPVNFFLAAKRDSMVFRLLLDRFFENFKPDDNVEHDATFYTGPLFMERNLDLISACRLLPADLFSPLADWNGNWGLQEFCANARDEENAALCRRQAAPLDFNKIFILHYWQHSWIQDRW